MLGEIKQYLNERWICNPCDKNMFTLDENSICKTCSNEPSVNCSFGGHELFPKPGYWRLDENSSNFFKCPNEDSCLGGSNAEEQSLAFY